MPLNVFWSNLWTMDVRERNTKLLLEAVTHMATTETTTYIITIEIVMYIMHRRKYHLHECNRDSHLQNFNKIATHIFAAETFTCRSVVETSNCIIATETVTFITATKRSTNISVAENTTKIIATEPQNLHNCNRHWHLHNCYRKCEFIVPTESATYIIDYRNFQRMSKDQV